MALTEACPALAGPPHLCGLSEIACCDLSARHVEAKEEDSEQSRATPHRVVTAVATAMVDVPKGGES